MKRRLIQLSVLAVVSLCVAPASWAQARPTDPAASYPNKTIRILVGFSAGSTTDVLARTIGQKMTEAWGQAVVVDNRPSAGGILASGMVASAPPDGYTLVSVSAGHAVSAGLYQKLRTTRSAISRA
jgi:tripartite-type tricarboxylate transporter receptor subunit TctC